MNPAFLITKWYLDCVTEDGDAVIIYAAELRWHRMRARYNSLLVKAGTNVTTRTTMRTRALPSSANGQIRVDIPPFALSGIWEADSDPVTRTVFESTAGAVQWNCLQPRSRVQLRVGGQEFVGLGYAECLTLTLPPWQLPLSELRWGRFVSVHDSVTWVDWQGEFATSFAVHNGAVCVPESVSDSRLVILGVTLDFQDSFLLRGGELRKTILPDAPALAKLLPNSLFGIEEHKWLSRGDCHAPDHSSSGWTVHEVVHWNR